MGHEIKSKLGTVLTCCQSLELAQKVKVGHEIKSKLGTVLTCCQSLELDQSGS